MSIGGYDGSTFLDSVECYDPEKDTWAEVTRMTSGRSGVGVAVTMEPCQKDLPQCQISERHNGAASPACQSTNSCCSSHQDQQHGGPFGKGAWGSPPIRLHRRTPWTSLCLPNSKSRPSQLIRDRAELKHQMLPHWLHTCYKLRKKCFMLEVQCWYSTLGGQVLEYLHWTTHVQHDPRSYSPVLKVWNLMNLFVVNCVPSWCTK